MNRKETKIALTESEDLRLTIDDEDNVTKY